MHPLRSVRVMKGVNCPLAGGISSSVFHLLLNEACKGQLQHLLNEAQTAIYNQYSRSRRIRKTRTHKGYATAGNKRILEVKVVYGYGYGYDSDTTSYSRPSNLNDATAATTKDKQQV